MQNPGSHLDQQHQKVHVPGAQALSGFRSTGPLPSLGPPPRVCPPLCTLHSLFAHCPLIMQIQYKTFCLMKALSLSRRQLIPTPLARAPRLLPLVSSHHMAMPRPHHHVLLLLVASRYQFPSPFPSLWTSWESVPWRSYLPSPQPWDSSVAMGLDVSHGDSWFLNLLHISTKQLLLLQGLHSLVNHLWRVPFNARLCAQDIQKNAVLSLFSKSLVSRRGRGDSLFWQ